ncbi:twin-arginine translocase subunit TatC [Protaetiibacter intestinalis]|uniref:Sec-independent protein translocase protein TatC n=2 Tax=Protaetiibacter intestinalis TaxID=2419774 RepID=A0A387BCN2_9MICO|nr:twin-arginine translocase subunit TatC [Protaetiibacter intestinalis]
MPLGAHLREARRRTAWSAVALLVGAVAGFLLAEPILELLRAPIEQLAESRNASLNYDSVTGAFDLRVKIAVVAGIVLSSPVWLFQLLAFLAPGLSRREKRYVFGFLGAAVPLFLGGCVTGFLIFPHVVELLAGFASSDDSTLLQASDYVDFVAKLVLATGVAFVLPVFLVVLNLMGLLSARSIARSWRYSVVAIVVFSALVTPAADVLSMFLVAVPMAVLFAAALLVTWLHDRRVARRALTDDVVPVAVGAGSGV